MGYQWETRPFGEGDMFPYGPIEPVSIWDIGLLEELRHLLLFLHHTIGTDTNFFIYYQSLIWGYMSCGGIKWITNTMLHWTRKGRTIYVEKKAKESEEKKMLVKCDIDI